MPSVPMLIASLTPTVLNLHKIYTLTLRHACRGCKTQHKPHIPHATHLGLSTCTRQAFAM